MHTKNLYMLNYKIKANGFIWSENKDYCKFNIKQFNKEDNNIFIYFYPIKTLIIKYPNVKALNIL